ncbi:hypothetical protein Tco_1066938 [Tanacetum coccineum]|uniref:Reverse transcriptase domain-containing protein n=1 Tax=Tanacetum coccineum TaxID=301880 RepID=A0ABQ5HBF7_9ASTR
MQISAFMSNSKCPELARRFSDQVPKTVTEMMKKVDDFLKSEEAYKSTELPRGEFPEKGQRTSYRGNRPPRAAYGGGQQRTDNHNTFNRKDHYQLEEVQKIDNLETITVRAKQSIWYGQGARAGSVNPREARGQSWMNTPITFPLVLADDVSNEPLVIEAKVEGPFGPNPDGASGFLWRATDSNGEGGIGSSIRKAVSSTVHAMIKFPTLKGNADLVARATSVFKCRRLEKKQAEQRKETKSKTGRQERLQKRNTHQPCFPGAKIIMEYLVNINKRRAFWSLNEDILKNIVLTTNTPYPSKKIRHIRDCTHQRPRRKYDQYAVSSEDQYAVLEI